VASCWLAPGDAWLPEAPWKGLTWGRESCVPPRTTETPMEVKGGERRLLDYP
jgi:hypothetical protein